MCKHIITCYSVIVKLVLGTYKLKPSNGAGGMEVGECVF
jgi:hypothetical protein